MRGLLIAAFATALLGTGCGAGERSCSGGRSVTCACADGTMGSQTCLGATYGPCSCEMDAGLDTGAGDATRPDTGAADTGAADTGVADTGVADTSVADMGAADTGIADADSGAADTGVADTGLPDTGPADTGAADTGAADTGPAVDVVGIWSIDRSAWASERCACSWESIGFDDVDECETEHGQSSSAVACARAELTAGAGPVADHLACESLAYSEATTCYGAISACDATEVTSCETLLTSALEACVEPAEYGPFTVAVNGCLAGISFCPDSSDTFGGTGTAVFSGTTVGATDHYDGSCGTTPAVDRAHLWAAFSANNYIIDTEGSEFDTVLYVIDVGESLSCLDGSELACNDDAVLGRPSSRVELWVDVLPRIMIVVEGKDPLQAGRYQVNINARRGL